MKKKQGRYPTIQQYDESPELYESSYMNEQVGPDELETQQFFRRRRRFFFFPFFFPRFFFVPFRRFRRRRW